jgi:hypothetical protein
MAGFSGASPRQSLICDQVRSDCDLDHAFNKGFEHSWLDSQAQVRLLRILTTGHDVSNKVECSLHNVAVANLPTTDYVALSYFWGETQTHNDVHEIIVDRQKYWVRTNLWTFLQHGLDHSLPIYIDAICLNQLDNEERGNQVKLMSEVYSHANQVHVWLGSPHAEQIDDLGLLRLDLTKRTPHSFWHPRSLIGLSYICSRDYWRRLWIVQELLLSKSAQIHCGPFAFSWNELSQLAKLPLQANILENPESITWCDAWVFTRMGDLSQQHIQNQMLFDGWQFALRIFHYRDEWLSRCSGPVDTSGLPIYRAVMAFQFQQCRDLQDKIYALFGLLDLQGRSMITPSYRSSQQQLFIDAAAACLVSRWRETTAPRSELSNDDRLYCDRLNTILGLTNVDLEARIREATKVAISYTRDKGNLMETPTNHAYRLERFDGLQAVPSHVTTLAERLTREAGYHSASVSFQHIFGDYMSHLNAAERADFAEVTPSILNATIAVIQNRQRRSKEMRNMTRLRCFIEQVMTYHEVLDISLGVSNVTAVVWVGVSLLSSVAEFATDVCRVR